jgi:hypothetical protein
MPSDRIEAAYFSPDIREFITLLHRHGVRYVVVGGEAVIYYGHARLTGDIDFFYDMDPANAGALFRSLLEFWGGNIPGVARVEDLCEEGVIFQFGRPPHRIDLLNRIDGVDFASAWASRRTVALETSAGDVPLHYVGRERLIDNKQAAGRPKDLEDLAFLRRKNQPLRPSRTATTNPTTT